MLCVVQLAQVPLIPFSSLLSLSDINCYFQNHLSMIDWWYTHFRLGRSYTLLICTRVPNLLEG